MFAMRPLILMLIGLSFASASSRGDSKNYLVGRGMADVTGPPVGVQLLGFVRADQISEGVHQRQWARAFVIGEPGSDKRVAIVVSDIAFPTHTLKLAVLERLKKEIGDVYNDANLIVAGTHTHGAAGEYHHHLANSPLGGRFCQPYFEALADGIAEAVATAHKNVEPADIYIARGDVIGGGVNRSLPAYMNNPEEERAKYPANTDTTMTLLKFVGESGDLGCLNWFAVHPTSMNYYNKLITGDNKGYASYSFERSMGNDYSKPDGFVAAFAQTNCGDVTPNLNLDNTGPGKTDTESTQIIGERQADVARKLFASANEKLEGPIDFLHTFTDFSKLTVSDEYTGEGEKHLCPSAFGYAFAAGSTEDGGGHPLFREGMTEQNPLIDSIIKAAANPPEPSAEFRKCQRPKAILFATGLYKPPMHEQVLPHGIVRIGPIVLAVGPCEYTTMTGRRIREGVAKALGVEPKDVVISGYSNDFAGYVTTRQEYEKQQYEGGHTLFGPWTEAGHRQQLVKLAEALKSNTTIEPTGTPVDMRTITDIPWNEGPDDKPFPTGAEGIAVAPKDVYAPGETVVAEFWTGNPSNDFQRTDRYLAVQKFDPDKNEWVTYLTDADWATTCRWLQTGGKETTAEKVKNDPRLDAFKVMPGGQSFRPDPFRATVTWVIEDGTPAGKYRLVHHGRVKQDGKVERFDIVTEPFTVGKP